MPTPRSMPIALDDAQPQLPNEPRSVIAEFLFLVARLCVLSVLIAAPWFFGGLATRVQYGLYIGILTALAFWLLGVVYRIAVIGGERTRLPLVFIPLSATLILGVYQLWPRPDAPTPQSIQAAIDRAMASTDDESDRVPRAKSALISTLQTGQSIAPTITRFEMVRLTFSLITFLLGTQLFATQMSQLWLWGMLAANGACLSFVGIAQQLSGDTKLLWAFPHKNAPFPFASFVNRNNAAGYLCICLGCALGFAAWAFVRSYLSPEVAKQIQHLRRHRQSITGVIDSITQLSAIQLCSSSVVILIAAGIVLASSRGGWVALVVAATVTALLASKSRGLSVWVFLASVGLFSAGLVLWSGLGQGVSKRWDQLSIDTIANDGRWSHWSDAIKAVGDFPVTGTGFGTYQFAYLPYQSHANIARLRFYNADNQFLEWLVESGVVGISLVICSLLSIAIASRALLYLVQGNSSEPAGLVGCFVLVSTCISAAFDFGPTMPANMLALAVVFGSIAGRAAFLANAQQFLPRTRGLTIPWCRSTLILPILGGLLIVCGGFGLRELKAAADAHSISRALPELDTADGPDEETTSALIADLSDAISRYPGDPDVHHAAAQLMIYRFRVQELRILMENSKGKSREELWAQTNPILLYRQINKWDRTGQYERIETTLDVSTIKTNLVSAYSQLQKAQASCSLIPDVDLGMATLAFLEKSGERSGESHLRRALLVAPVSPLVSYEIAELAQYAGLSDFSRHCARRSLKLSSRYLMPIHRFVSEQLPLDEEIQEVLPDSAELLLQLAQTYKTKNDISSVQKLADRAIEILTQPVTDSQEAGRHYNLGRAHILCNEPEEAIQEYRRALERSPYQSDWRLELTDILLRHKGVHWALREAETAAYLAPQNKRLLAVVRDLQEATREPAKPVKKPIH